MIAVQSVLRTQPRAAWQCMSLSRHLSQDSSAKPRLPEITVRAIEARDRMLVEQFAGSLSYSTRYFRFGNGLFEFTSDELDRICNGEPNGPVRLAAVTVENGAERIVGLARLFASPGQREAELTITVADAWQGQGVGELLLRALIDSARTARLERLVATVLATNDRMQRLLTSCGFEIAPHGAQAGLRLASLQI
jgi:RimJ/RimL family protein N-acetyltransferase